MAELLNTLSLSSTPFSIKATVADVSLRHTGYCVININYNNQKLTSSIRTSGAIRSKAAPSSVPRFQKWEHNAQCAKKVKDKLQSLERHFETNLTIIELPDFSQSHVSGFAMGAVWGSCAELRNAIMIEPNCLKEWSSSNRGDHKTKVLELVKSRVILPANQINNNNIVDAVGIALLFSDLIYEHLQAYKKPNRSSSLLFRLQGDDSTS